MHGITVNEGKIENYDGTNIRLFGLMSQAHIVEAVLCIYDFLLREERSVLWAHNKDF